MALNLNFSSGDNGSGIIPIVKYDARAGRISKRDYVGGEYVTTDITKTFSAIADFENIETGWIAFTPQGPDMAVAKFGDQVPAQPSPEHKQGVRLLMQLNSKLDGTVRELASSAKAFLRGIDDLHSKYLEGAKQYPGLLPIIKLADTVLHTTGEGTRKSTNYIPVFEIVKWVDRPEKLVYTPKMRMASNTQVQISAPPATGSATFVAPVSGIADAEDDFG